MKLGSQDNVDSSPNQSLNGSFRKTRSGLSQNDLDLSPGHSVDGSFRMSNSVMSARSLSGISTSSKSLPTSRRVLKALKDYARTLLDLELFTQNLDDWVSENLDEDSNNKKQRFKTLFSIDELRMLDLALDGVLFQQLNRMPCSIYESDDTLRDEYLAIEEFLLAVVNGLWHTFWRQSGHFPFVLSCPRYPGSKFHTIEKAISRGRVDELCGLALLSKIESDKNVRWDQVVEFILFKEDILSGNEPKLSASVISEAFFYGVHILLARALRRQCTVGSDSVFILVFDSQFGAVVKLGGDLGKLDTNSTNPYHSVVEWIKCHAGIGISSVSQVWNKLGNPNWRDLGTLQVLLTTFTSMVQWNGQPKKSIAALASEHSVRLQKQRLQFKLVKRENALVPYLNNMHKVEIPENALVPYSNSMHEGEIQELEPSDNSYFLNQSSHLKFRHGEILLLDDQRQAQKGFQIQDSLVAGNNFLYTAVSLDLPEELLTLYAGAHPSKLEPSWEDMSMWYQVQRQTKVLNILREQGVASKYLPQITASGRLSHSGPCNKRSPSDCCDHPWCGMPILVTSPVGEPLSFVVAHEGPLSSEEAKRCCRDCLTALRSASVANIQHGDICPENILRVTDPQGTGQRFFYVPISWGRAVLEDRDSPAINIQFSSSRALQQGKLCPSSDAESLIYVLYFVSGGMMQQQDSIESALQWREKSWAKRVIQQQLGEVSPLLKAFTDYVDSLCGTPYPVDYDVWLKRLNRAVDGSADRGKMVEELSNLRLEDVAESSGASACGGVKLSSRIM